MEHLIEIDNTKLTALEIQILAYVAGECEGVWSAEDDEDVDSLREPLDQLVLSGFLERDCDLSGWLNTWRVPADAWEVIDPHIDMINHVLDMIGEA